MRVRAYYNQYIKPNYAEGVNEGREYSPENIPIILRDITHNAAYKEIVKGIKQTDFSLVCVIENDVYDKQVNDIRQNDRVYIFGKEHRVQSIQTKVHPKFYNKVARNPNLIERYQIRVVVLSG